MPPQATTDSAPVQRNLDQDKRRAIIEAAQNLFTTVGYETTTMAQIAKQAGVAVGTVYLYFKNKNDLLIAVKGGWEEEVIRALSLPEIVALPHHLRARPMLEACFQICARHAELVQLMGMQAEMVGDWHSEVPVPILDALKAFLHEAMEAGAVRQVDTDAASVALFGMVNSTLLQCFCYENGAHQERYIATLVDAIERWLINPELASSRNAD